MKKIAIIGHGYVGKAMHQYFGEHYDIAIYDPALGYDDTVKINECELAVVCVPTPMLDDGTCDTTIVEEVFEWLRVPLVLVKSTVPPGTTNYLQTKYPHGSVAFSPEYIGEGKYEVQWWKDKGYPHPTDMRKHDFFIFGGRRDVTSKIIAFFQTVTGPDPKYIQTDSVTAELTKYMENSWGAMKVTFCNEFYEIAKALGVDYNEMRELWLLDGRVERMHTAVFPDKRGFGGKCFPKDVNGIVKRVEASGYVPELLLEVLRSNSKFRGQ